MFFRQQPVKHSQRLETTAPRKSHVGLHDATAVTPKQEGRIVLRKSCFQLPFKRRDFCPSEARAGPNQMDLPHISDHLAHTQGFATAAPLG